ncbi:MAG TPA: DUF2203 domain-containing protein [Gemmatimonadales bacterium]|nr:DUF2203 domain-containing protein [Gemmatimonadales bacterium]
MAEARIFTLDEAERTLPLLRRILTDLRTEYRIWQEALADYELLSGGTRAESGEAEELVTSRRAVTDSADRISAYLGEIEAIGCLFKGFDAGLVDFYTLREDRLVLLCWRVDEEHITHWHEVDAGYSGRQPIDSTFLTTTAS